MHLKKYVRKDVCAGEESDKVQFTIDFNDIYEQGYPAQRVTRAPLWSQPWERLLLASAWGRWLCPWSQAQPKEGHGSFLDWTHNALNKSSGTIAVWIGWH